MWLLPSRGRPANLARFFEAYRRTGGATPGMVLVADWDDAAYAEIELPLGWILERTPCDRQGDKVAAVWDRVKDCSWLGLIGDDCVPVTPGWDLALVEGLSSAGIVSCNDGWQAPKRLGNCWIIAGELLRAVGYLFPPGLQHLYVDDVWETIGTAAQCWLCRMDVLVEHRHVLKGEAAADTTHRVVYGSDTSDPQHGQWPEDTEAYIAWQRLDKEKAVAAARQWRTARYPAVEPAAADPQPGAAELDPQSRQRLDYCRGRSVMLLTPIHEHPTWQYTVGYAETCVMFEQLRIRYASRFVVGSSNLPKARNILVARFLASGFDDALLIDCDMGWSANSALRLLASDKEVIAAVGRKKVDRPNTDPNVWCCHFGDEFLEPGTGTLHQDEMGAVQLSRVGTGFMKISRSVFEKMIAAHPEWKREGTPEMEPEVRRYYYQFFKFDDETELGEDYHFCERWRELGGAVWIDPSITLSHAGAHAWSGKIAELMVAAPAVEAAA